MHHHVLELAIGGHIPTQHAINAALRARRLVVTCQKTRPTHLTRSGAAVLRDDTQLVTVAWRDRRERVCAAATVANQSVVHCLRHRGPLFSSNAKPCHSPAVAVARLAHLPCPGRGIRICCRATPRALAHRQDKGGGHGRGLLLRRSSLLARRAERGGHQKRGQQ